VEENVKKEEESLWKILIKKKKYIYGIVGDVGRRFEHAIDQTLY
jgi:hypothetical protein